MKEITGNIWNHINDGWIIVPVNGFVKKSGENVMGRGVAAQAKIMFPRLPMELGSESSAP